jgi:hypothetical protein
MGTQPVFLVHVHLRLSPCMNLRVLYTYTCSVFMSYLQESVSTYFSMPRGKSYVLVCVCEHMCMHHLHVCLTLFVCMCAFLFCGTLHT